MTEIQNKLYLLRDENYAAFLVRLIPGLTPARILGVRVPELRRLAKELYGSEHARVFLAELPHPYFDEDMLHAVLLCQAKDNSEALSGIDAFLPYVDNWAVCDTLRPPVLKRYNEELREKALAWCVSEETYICRLGIGILLSYFLEEDFSSEFPEIISSIRSQEYYVNMMIAWYFATALAKHWDNVLPFMINGCLDVWTHNKTIQKSVESFRFSKSQKDFLRTLRRKQS